jgi:predicted amidohydrolase
VGDVDNNLNRADAVLSKASPEDLDLLVLPELAFTGYNFKSLSHISPFLEPSCAGVTSLWARTTALKHNCIVAAGYPEKVDVSQNWPTSEEYYNSLIVVNEDGDTIVNYRKTHLYYTDETWALENAKGFFGGYIPGVGETAMGICMDINPYRFEMPWSKYEFASHVLAINANVVVLSMAWLTREDAREFSRMPKDPDMDTLTYWVARLEPLIRSEGDDEIIVIFANRCGVEDDAVYAGTSAVLGVKQGNVHVYGLLGRGEKELLVVDTEVEPIAHLVYRPEEGQVDNLTAEQNVTTVPAKDMSEAGQSDLQSSSTTSLYSDTQDSQMTRSNASGSLLDDYDENFHQPLGGHPLDITTPLTEPCSSTPIEESPLSPRRLWSPSEHSNLPGPASLESRKSSNSYLFQVSETPKSHTPHRPESAKAVAHPGVAETLRNASSTPGSVRDSLPAYRSSSRAQSRMMADRAQPLEVNSAGESTTNAMRRPALQAEQESQSPRRYDRNRPPEVSRDRMADFGSPDMEKIGADLMVFVEGRQPRRDSLVCHADEDDFVVLHSSQTDDLRHSKRHTPRSTGKGHGRPTSKSSKGGGLDSISRRTGTPQESSSSVHSSYRSHSKTSPGRTQDTQDASNTRDMSRGRQRDKRSSPRKESSSAQDSLSQPRLSQSQTSRAGSQHQAKQALPSMLTEKLGREERRSATISKIHEPSAGERMDDGNQSNKNSASRQRKHTNKKSPVRSISIVTDKSSMSPTTPGFPRTPKAMILIPQTEEEHKPQTLSSTKDTGMQLLPLRCVEKVERTMEATYRHNRPKSAIW